MGTVIEPPRPWHPVGTVLRKIKDPLPTPPHPYQPHALPSRHRSPRSGPDLAPSRIPVSPRESPEQGITRPHRTGIARPKTLESWDSPTFIGNDY
jgi:hypothetical protein